MANVAHKRQKRKFTTLLAKPLEKKKKKPHTHYTFSDKFNIGFMQHMSRLNAASFSNRRSKRPTAGVKSEPKRWSLFTYYNMVSDISPKAPNKVLPSHPRPLPKHQE